MRTALLSTLLISSAIAPAQDLTVTPAVRGGGTLATALRGAARAPYVTYLDTDGGPVRFAGVDLFLGLTGGLLLLDAGTLDVNGTANRRYLVPNSGWPVGLGAYLQSAIADAAAPNGMFRVTDGETAFRYQSTAILAEKFTDAQAAGFTGTYDQTFKGRLMARAVTRRTVTYTPNGALFGQPLAGDLDRTGVRIQKVYRATDLYATGTPEVLVGMHWEAFRTGPLADDVFVRMAIDVSHSNVVPDFSVGPSSALPLFPNSGLGRTFANHPSSTPVRVHDGPYAIRIADLRNGYMPYPRPAREFVYDGKSSLLLDFMTYPNAITKGTNGQQVYLMVTSSPRPDARAFIRNTPNPGNAITATDGDNAQTGMRFEFAQVFSEATSPWRVAPVASPNYHQPYVGSSVPRGGSITIEYRGATSRTGTGATAWSTNIDGADNQPFLQYRVRFRSAVDGARASLDALVIPIN